MASMQDLIQLITAYQKQKRQNDGAPPFERGVGGKAGVPFAITKIPGAPTSATVPIPPFNGIGDVNVMDMPGASEGAVRPGGTTQGLSYEEGIAATLEPNMADRVRRELAVRQGTSKGGVPGDRTAQFQPSKYSEDQAEPSTPKKSASKINPFAENVTPPVETAAAPQLTPPAIPQRDESPAPFLSTLTSGYTPNVQGSPRPSETPEEEGMFSRALRNPLFLTGAGMMANAKKGPFEAGGIALLNAAQINQQNRRFDKTDKLTERRLANEEARTVNQDAYQRERNTIADRRDERNFEYQKSRDQREQDRLTAATHNQNMNRTVAIQAQVEKEIDSQRDALMGDPKLLAEFDKKLPEIRRRLFIEKSNYLRLMTPGVGISFQDFAAGPYGGIR